MKDQEYNGYLLVETTSGGRAGKSFNKTASIKIMSHDKKTMYGRYFSFWKIFPHTKEKAIQRAKLYVDNVLRK